MSFKQYLIGLIHSQTDFIIDTIYLAGGAVLRGHMAEVKGDVLILLDSEGNQRGAVAVDQVIGVILGG